MTPNNYLIHMDDGSDVLAHHGTKGQRWGFRRYQNRDGSLTPAGRVHYGIGEARDDSKSTKKKHSFFKRKEKEPEAPPKKDISQMTSAEINREIKKMELERNYYETKRRVEESYNKQSGSAPEEAFRSLEGVYGKTKYSYMSSDDIDAFVSRLDLEEKLNKKLNPSDYEPKKESRGKALVNTIIDKSIEGIGRGASNAASAYAEKLLREALGLPTKKDQETPKKKDEDD